MVTSKKKLDVLSPPKATGKGHGIDPWGDVASAYAPNDMVNALELCEFLFLRDPTYQKASEKIVDYFLTELKVSGQSSDENTKFWEILQHDFGMLDVLREVGIDFMAYTNSFTTISFPFTRVLVCPRCKIEVNINHFRDFSYHNETGKFISKCQKCNHEGPMRVKDYKKKDTKLIKLIRWNPKLIHINANRLTHDVEYSTEIPPEIKAAIVNQDKFLLRTTPKDFLEAARLNKQFKFNDNHIFHMKNSHLAGLWLGGWGLPSILSVFNNFFRLQILRRYNEALQLDYILPLRIISPAQGSYQDGNPIYNSQMANWKMNFEKAVARHRVDGTDWNFFPFPVNYQAVGGEARALSPVEQIDSEEDKILNGRGIPPELYRSSLSLHAAPIALRVFERQWSHLVRGFNLLAQKTADAISKYQKQGDFDVELESVRILDDLENKAWRLQAMAAGIISKETGMVPMGITDPMGEYKKVLDQQQHEAELAQEKQREMEMAQMGLGQTQGQQEEGSGSEPTPGDINAEGDRIARQLLDPNVSETDRKRMLSDIREQNETLHAVVIKRMNIIRNTARSMGMTGALPQAIQETPPPE